MPRTFKLNNEIYDIPDEHTEQFLQQNPNSQELKSYTVGKDTFDIPLDFTQKFEQQYPNAGLLNPNLLNPNVKSENILPSPLTNFSQQDTPSVQAPLRSTEPIEQKQPEIKPLTQEDITNLPKFDQTYKLPEQIQSEKNIKEVGEYMAKKPKVPDVSKITKQQYTEFINKQISDITKDFEQENKRQDKYRYGTDWITEEFKSQPLEGDIQNYDEFVESFKKTRQLRHTRNLLKQADKLLNKSDKKSFKSFIEGLKNPLAEDFSPFH